MNFAQYYIYLIWNEFKEDSRLFYWPSGLKVEGQCLGPRGTSQEGGAHLVPLEMTSHKSQWEVFIWLPCRVTVDRWTSGGEGSIGRLRSCLWTADKQHASLSSKLSLMKSKDSWEIAFEAAELSRQESDPTTWHLQGVDVRLRFETIKKLHEVVSSSR